MTTTTRAAKPAERSPWMHLMPLLAVLSVVDGYFHGGVWNYQTFVFAFPLVAILDFVFGRRKPAPADRLDLGRSWTWQVPLFGWAFAQTALLMWAVWLIGSGALSDFELVGFALSFGIVGAVGIVVAHELVHRRRPLEQSLAELLMTQVSYTHFCIEHVYGHHVHVATPRDPATARAGEGYYAFLARTIPGGLASAWRIETQRLGRKGYGAWTWRNKMLRYAAELALLYLVVALAAGWLGIAFLIVQGAVAFLLFEAVNYIEHYGLERRELSPGRYEPFRARHAWDSYHRATNLNLFNLGIHAEHHRDANVAYPDLRQRPEAPQMPAGYTGMLLLAFVPPLWRKVMDPRVEDWRRRTQSEATA